MCIYKFRASSRRGFTLIELLTVMAVIAVLAGLLLGVSSMVQKNAAKGRAQSEIKALESALESYKADNAVYPSNTDSDALDPRVSGNSAVASGKTTAYSKSSLFLYSALSGDLNANFKTDSGESKPYYEFKPDMLNTTKDPNSKIITAVNYIQDPFGNSYGYSTANAADMQKSPPPQKPR